MPLVSVPPKSPLFTVKVLTTAIGKVTTAATLGVLIEEHCLTANLHPWPKKQWIQRLTEATQTNVTSTASVLREYMEGFDVQTPDFNLGSCILTLTRLACTMKQSGVYWC